MKINREKFFFGYDKNTIYLDNGASTLALSVVKEAADKFLLSYGSIHRGAGKNSQISTGRYEAARETILKYLNGAQDDCVIFTANTTDAVNKAALIYPFKEGDKVLTSDIEHTSNFLPWAKRAEVVRFTAEDFRITPEQIGLALEKDPNVRLVAITAASNVSGYITDIKAVHEVTKKYGKDLFVDYSQYAPHAAPNLGECELLAYCGHKMYAPFGCGCLAGRKSILKNEGNSLTGGGNVLYVSPEGVSLYKDAPWMHEAGTPNGVGAIAFAKAHDVLYGEIGEQALKEHDKELLKAMSDCTDVLEKADFRVYFTGETEDRTPVMLADNKIKENALTARLLAEGKPEIAVREGAFCAYRFLERLKPELSNVRPITSSGKLHSGYSVIRLSAGLINTPEDIYSACERLVRINKNF